MLPRPFTFWFAVVWLGGVSSVGALLGVMLGISFFRFQVQGPYWPARLLVAMLAFNPGLFTGPFWA